MTVRTLKNSSPSPYKIYLGELFFIRLHFSKHKAWYMLALLSILSAPSLNEWVSEWWFNAMSATKAIFTARTCWVMHQVWKKSSWCCLSYGSKCVYIQDGCQATILNYIKNLFDVHNPQTIRDLCVKFQTIWPIHFWEIAVHGSMYVCMEAKYTRPSIPTKHNISLINYPRHICV